MSRICAAWRARTASTPAASAVSSLETSRPPACAISGLPPPPPLPPPAELEKLAQSVQEVGAKLGLQHFGGRFSLIGNLTRLGLAYLKIDGSYIRAYITRVEMGGIFGTIMVAVYGAASFTAQFGALIIVGLYTIALTWGIARAVALVFPMRVDKESETNGLDISTHGERAYDLNS